MEKRTIETQTETIEQSNEDDKGSKAAKQDGAKNDSKEQTPNVCLYILCLRV